MLIPLVSVESALAAYNDVTSDGTPFITLPSNGKNYSIDNSTKVQSITVNGDNTISLVMLNGSIAQISSADLSPFTATVTSCTAQITCGGLSTAYISCPNLSSGSETVVLTVGSGTCTPGGSTGSTGSSSSGGGGGGGAPAPAVTPTTPAATTPPATAAPAPTPLAAATPTAVSAPASPYVFTSTLRSGSRGNAVTQLQTILNANGFLAASPNGRFGPATRKALIAFQKANALKPTGILDKVTRDLLNSGSYVSAPAPVVSAPAPVAAPAVFTNTLGRGSRGSAVKQLQAKLQALGYMSAKPNGTFGPATMKAVKAFQNANNLKPSGKLDKATRDALNAM